MLLFHTIQCAGATYVREWREIRCVKAENGINFAGHVHQNLSLSLSHRRHPRRPLLGQPLTTFRPCSDSLSRILGTPREQRRVYFPWKITTSPDNAGYRVEYNVSLCKYGGTRGTLLSRYWCVGRS